MKKKTRNVLIILAIVFVLYTGYVGFFVDSEHQNILLFVPSFVLLAIIVFILAGVLVGKASLFEINKLKKELSLSRELYDSMVKNNKILLESFPVGIIIYNNDGFVSYSNDYSNQIFKMKNTLGKTVDALSKELYSKALSSDNFEIDIFDKHYLAYSNRDAKTIYLIDDTNKEKAIASLRTIKPCIMNIEFDNMDSVSTLELKEMTELLSKYYKVIEKWRDKLGLFQISSSQDNLIFVFGQNQLNALKDDEFSILRSIDKLSKETGSAISISIGVGTDAEDYKTLGLYTDKALEFAKDRGGAQAVVFDGDNYKTYQGSGLSYEKRSRASSRVYAKRFAELIKQSSSVIVMPHIDTDADGFASAYLVMMMANALGTPAKVLVDKTRLDSTVNKIIKASKNEYVVLENELITEDELESLTNGKPLLVLVDHHDTKLSCSKKVYNMVDQITVIDHHRLTSQLEFDPVIEHIDHNASSAVELVSELIEILLLEMDIPSFVSTALLVGMIIDTNDFRVHTSELTFKTASFLMSHGADTQKAKMLLRENLEAQINKSNILKEAYIFNAHALIKLDGIVNKETIAKAAESLLDVEGIKASFAIGRLSKNTIGVSSRSNGDFNCHAEMEKLGGGGHFNGGAAQIESKEVDEVFEIILNNLSTVEGGVDKMKVILIEDVKKQGKKGDVIEVTPGYANFLLSKKFAVEANADNLQALSMEKQAKADRDKEELDIAKKTKDLIESIDITIKVKLGESGKLFGAISAKQVAEELYKEHKVEVDKRKVNLPDEKIDSIGTYDCLIKLHKEVTAKLKLNVCEE